MLHPSGDAERAAALAVTRMCDTDLAAAIVYERWALDEVRRHPDPFGSQAWQCMRYLPYLALLTAPPPPPPPLLPSARSCAALGVLYARCAGAVPPAGRRPLVGSAHGAAPHAGAGGGPGAEATRNPTASACAPGTLAAALAGCSAAEQGRRCLRLVLHSSCIVKGCSALPPQLLPLEQGYGRHSAADQEALVREELAALSTLLGGRRYFFSDAGPHAVDAAAFGVLDQMAGESSFHATIWQGVVWLGCPALGVPCQACPRVSTAVPPCLPVAVHDPSQPPQT